MPVTTQPPRLTSLSYEDLRAWTNLVGGDVDKYIDTINAAGYDVSEMQAVEDLASGYMDFYKSGDGTYTVTQFKDTFQNVTTNPIDSNISTTARGNISQMLNRGKDAITGKLNISKFPASGSFATKASYVVGSTVGAIGAVSTGIALGKAISPHLYDVAPNFWERIGVNEGSFDPENWKGITNGSDSPFAGLLNFILGIDPETGNTQAYMDENAFAYMAYALAQNGVFDSGHYESYIPSGYTPSTDIYEPIKTIDISDLFISGYSSDNKYYYTREYMGIGNDASDLHNVKVMYFTNEGFYQPSSSFYNYFYLLAPSDFNYRNLYYKSTKVETATGKITVSTDHASTSLIERTVNNQSFRIAYSVYSGISNYESLDTNAPINSNGGKYDLRNSNSTTFVHNNGYVVLFGDTIQAGNVEGIASQPDATLPDVSGWNDIPSTLQSLQSQYPDMFQNPLVWDNVQPDGTNPQLRYIPVPMPTATSNTDTKPISDTQTQTQTVVNPDTSTATLIKLITELATKTSTDSDPSIPPQNPTDTGTGKSPTPLPPSGSASALWSVYHPTQAQVNSFGAWLWTDNIITQIQQVLQNPMEGIITLHKVFAMPVDSGSGSIVVGRLDSQVPSATVTQQYVTVDCGSVDCLEYFGNVFDYSPHTNISLYLPFIGIVPLNTDDIMRSTIHVVYGVDVFTGACLAMVEVTRDGNTVNMYQYSGVASVEYPLTGSVHGGLITGLLGVAGSVATTVATGGVTAPAAVAAVGGLASAGKSQNARASGFSGNAGAMGIKVPYLIIERPQTKVAQSFPELAGYPTNYSCKLSDCSNHVVVKHVHVEGINATENELNMIHTLLASGVIV